MTREVVRWKEDELKTKTKCNGKGEKKKKNSPALLTHKWGHYISQRLHVKLSQCCHSSWLSVLEGKKLNLSREKHYCD